MCLRDPRATHARVTLRQHVIDREESDRPRLHKSVCCVDAAIPQTLNPVVARLLPRPEPRTKEPAWYSYQNRYRPRRHGAIVVLALRRAIRV